MSTIIIIGALAIATTLVLGVCAAAMLYVNACDEKTREEMGIRI